MEQAYIMVSLAVIYSGGLSPSWQPCRCFISKVFQCIHPSSSQPLVTGLEMCLRQSDILQCQVSSSFSFILLLKLTLAYTESQFFFFFFFPGHNEMSPLVLQSWSCYNRSNTVCVIYGAMLTKPKFSCPFFQRKGKKKLWFSPECQPIRIGGKWGWRESTIASYY